MRLSLLPTGPPPVFQHWWVRSSTPCYGRFNLPMGRSPGFASIAPDNVALFRLGFPVAPPLKGLTGPDTITRRIIMQKARGQARLRRIDPPTACKHGVSGSVSSPRRGSSHRSVALLGSLSVVIEYLALRDGPRRFGPGFTCPTLLGYRLGPPVRFAYRAFTRCGASFQRTSASTSRSHIAGPTTPEGNPSGLGSSPFARRY
jgi:hypothetical protein